MKDTVSQTWSAKLESMCQLKCGDNDSLKAFWRANADAVGTVLRSSSKEARTGYSVVFNISSAHVASFCAGNYKNAYDLDADHKNLGEPHVSATRKTVDSTLEAAFGTGPKDIYFGAIEINGQGVGFYGDICLVLKDGIVPDETIVLDRNSYDLTRSPLSDQIESPRTPSSSVLRTDMAKCMSGYLGDDIGEIAAAKVAAFIAPRERRLTTGMISEAICSDEDYLEVLKIGTFTAADLKEARLSAADVAFEERTHRKSIEGPPPTLVELIWASRRRTAERALNSRGVPIKVVTRTGRIKG